MRGTLEDAIVLAAEKFRGVRDKEGQPYILHLLRVAMNVTDPDARIVGLLHDIVEDTDITLDDLREQAFSTDVVSAVDRLTHRPDVSYTDYIIGIRKHAIACLCKIADLQDNYRLDRVAYRDGHVDDDSRRVQRYILSYQFLQDKIDESTYRRLMKAVES
jgi:NADPH-dependent 7-cyano-7-deazaguanine reductase QueF